MFRLCPARWYDMLTKSYLAAHMLLLETGVTWQNKPLLSLQVNDTFLEFSISYWYITHYWYCWFPQGSHFTSYGFYITDNIEVIYWYVHTHPYISFVIDLIDVIYDTKGFISWGRNHMIYNIDETWGHLNTKTLPDQ